MERSLKKALEAWSGIVGPEHVVTDEGALASYRVDVGGEQRNVPAVVRPATTEQVQAIVRAANEHHQPIYPVSCGRNWGMGGRLPARDDAVVVDLGRMNEIHEVNVAQHCAVIGPGVTQRQLYDHIVAHDLPLVLNVTGSACDTSLIGNALERGVGYFASRADALSGLEVVLGTGDILRTGCGHFPNSVTTHVNRHGLGPSLDGLFGQSNYGIVTRAGIELIPKRERHVCMVCKIDDVEKVGTLIDRLAVLRQQDLIQTAVHIANSDRSRISVCPVIYDYLRRNEGCDHDEAKRRATELFEGEGFGAWSAVGGVMGTAAQLRESKRHVREAVRGLGKVIFITDGLVSFAKSAARWTRFIPAVRRKEILLYASEPFYGLSKGIPTDAAMGSVSWPVTGDAGEPGAELGEGSCGLMYCLPMIPMNGAAARRVMAIAKETFGWHRMRPYVTFNMVSTKALESVINLAFDRRNDDQTDEARAAINELHDALMAEGFVPYRTSIRMMDRITDENDVYWQVVRDLKKVLDPNHVIAPGRYNMV